MSEFIPYFIQVNGYLIVLWLFVEFSIKQSTNYRFIRFFLLLGIGLSTLLPLLKISSLSRVNSTAFVNSFVNEVIVQDASINYNQGLNWLGILFTIYLIGVIVQLIRFISSIIKLIKLHKLSQHAKDYREVPKSSVAFSFFNFIFIGSNLSEKNKQMVLKHELIHSKKLHSIDLLICEFLEIVFWFNPIIYKIQQQFVEQHEYEADDLSCSKNQPYIELLLQQNFDSFNHSFIHQFNTNHLKTRIMRLTTNTTKKVSAKAVTLSVFAFGVIFLTNCTPEKVDTDPTKSDIVEQPINTEIETTNSEIVKQPEKSAEFPGGIDALYSYIGNNITYPEKAKQDSISGTVYIQFTIDSEGNPKDYKVLRGINEELDEAALKVFKEMPKWTPAENEGKNVATLMTMPIKFQLPKK